MASCMWNFPCLVRLTALQLQLLKGIDSLQRMTSNILYRELPQRFDYIFVNKYMLMNYLILLHVRIISTVMSVQIYNITININVTYVCALNKVPNNVKPTNKVMLFIYIIIHFVSYILY